MGFLDMATNHFAPGNLVVRGQTQPGGKVFNGRPAAHIETNFSNDFLGRDRINAINLGQIEPTGLVQGGPQIEMRVVFSFSFLFWGWQGFLFEVDLGLKGSKLGFNFEITFVDFVAVIVIQIQSLLESKQMLRPIVALQGFGNFIFTALAAGMTMLVYVIYALASTFRSLLQQAKTTY